MSWIQIEDAVGAVQAALTDPTLSGPLNVVSPNSLVNAGFTRALGRIFGRQLPMAVPPALLRLIYGRMADEALLSSCHAVPSKLKKTGYAFKYENLEDALYQALAMEKVEA